MKQTIKTSVTHHLQLTSQPEGTHKTQSFFFFHVFSHPSITNSRQFDWFADSGATQHMTDQLSMLHNFVATTVDDWLVTGIGDSKLIVKGKGEVVITSIVNGKSLNGNNICPLPLYKEKHH